MYINKSEMQSVICVRSDAIHMILVIVLLLFTQKASEIKCSPLVDSVRDSDVTCPVVRYRLLFLCLSTLYSLQCFL